MAVQVNDPLKGPDDSDEKRSRKTRLAQLESDMAYFQARLEIIGVPQTANQAAQRRAFKLLHKALAAMVVREKRRMLDQG